MAKNKYVEVFVTITDVSSKSLKIFNGANETWISMAAIHEATWKTLEAAEGYAGMLIIPRYIAEEKGLVDWKEWAESKGMKFF